MWGASEQAPGEKYSFMKHSITQARIRIALWLSAQPDPPYF
jgi:hypothetical protein